MTDSIRKHFQAQLGASQLVTTAALGELRANRRLQSEAEFEASGLGHDVIGQRILYYILHTELSTDHPNTTTSVVHSKMEVIRIFESELDSLTGQVQFERMSANDRLPIFNRLSQPTNEQ